MQRDSHHVPVFKQAAVFHGDALRQAINPLYIIVFHYTHGFYAGVAKIQEELPACTFLGLFWRWARSVAQTLFYSLNGHNPGHLN
jgi:hypothetical protein